MSKKATTSLETNESSMIRPVELELPAEGVEKVVAHPDPAHNGEAAWQEFIVHGPKMLGKAFPCFQSASQKDKAFIHENFSTRSYEARAPQLRKFAEANGDIPSSASLTERARDLLAR